MHPWAWAELRDTRPISLDLVPGAGAAARKRGERAPPAGVQSPLRLWEPPLSAALSPLHVQGLRFLPRRPASPPAPGGGRWPPDPRVPAPSPPGLAACSRGQPFSPAALAFSWRAGRGPCLVHRPSHPGAGAGAGARPRSCRPRSPTFPSHALRPFLHCLPEIPVGLPLPCCRRHTCPLLPPATTLCTTVLLPALDLHPPEPTVGPSASRSAASRPSGTLTSVVVKVGSGPRALMRTRAARATPVQPEAESEATFQGLRGTQPP